MDEEFVNEEEELCLYTKEDIDLYCQLVIGTLEENKRELEEKLSKRFVFDRKFLMEQLDKINDVLLSKYKIIGKLV